LGGRRIIKKIRGLEQLETAIILHILQRIPWIDGDDAHTLALRFKVHDGHIREHLVGSRPLGKPGLVAAVSALQPSGRSDELALLHKAPCILHGKDHHLPAEAAEIVSSAASWKTNLRLLVGPAYIG